MKRFLFVFSFVTVILLSSCEGDEYVTYRFTSLDIDHVTSAPGIPIVTYADSMAKELYGMRLYLHPVELSRDGRYFDAYESSVVNEDPITKIKINCVESFDATHPAGTEITNYFVYVPGNYVYAQPLKIGEGLSPTAKYNPDYESVNLPMYADILLSKQPDFISYRRFAVTLTCKSGTVYNDTCGLIKLY